MVKGDEIWRGGASYPGKPSCTGNKSHKTESCEGEPGTAEGAEGGRFTGSTYDSGPKKPGNRVEDKTLKIGKSTS